MTSPPVALESEALRLWAGLTASSKKEVGAAYEKLLSLSHKQRMQWLAATDMPASSREILSRLAATDRLNLDRMPTRLADLIAPPAARPGDEFDAWEVISEIGQGGMGEVYLVRRSTEGTDQFAAMKLLSMLSTSRIEKELFRRESQYLARLGRLIDNGQGTDGTQYIVMGFASEGSITSYCDRRRLGTRERMKLFCELCEEVAHLHECGIIHCDIKPDNVLVAADGNIHLIDFSIARLIEHDDRPAPRSYTRDYAAPEQRLPEPEVSVRTDVFALGRLLEDLLIGSLAQREPSPRRGLRERLQHDPKAAQQLAHARSTDVKTLAADFGRGIDHILTRAQATQPAQRYACTGELHRAALRFKASLPNPDLAATAFWLRAWRVYPGRICAALLGTLLCGVALGSALWR